MQETKKKRFPIQRGGSVPWDNDQLRRDLEQAVLNLRKSVTELETAVREYYQELSLDEVCRDLGIERDTSDKE